MQAGLVFNQPTADLRISGLLMSDNRLGLVLLPVPPKPLESGLPAAESGQQTPAVEPEELDLSVAPLAGQLAAWKPLRSNVTVSVTDVVLVGASVNGGCGYDAEPVCPTSDGLAAARALPQALDADLAAGCGARLAF